MTRTRGAAQGRVAPEAPSQTQPKPEAPRAPASSVAPASTQASPAAARTGFTAGATSPPRTSTPVLSPGVPGPSTQAASTEVEAGPPPLVPVHTAQSAHGPTPPDIEAAVAEAVRVLGPPSSWPEAARRELKGHLSELSLDPQTATPLEDLARAELELAQEWGVTLTPTQFATAISRAVQAQGLRPEPHAALFGFTRLVDARFRFTPRVLDALVRAAVKQAGSEQALLDAIDRAPDNGEAVNRRPRTEVDLVASLVRQLCVGGGGSLQIDLDERLDGWLKGVLRDAKVPMNEAMGGAGAFGANIAAAMGGIDTRFFSREPLPAKIDQTFHADIQYVGPSGTPMPRAEAVDHQAPTRINFSAEYRYGWDFSVLGKKRVRVDGQERPVRPGGTGRVILGTPTSFEPGFGPLTPEALESLGKENDLFFLVGPHYFTKAAPEEAGRKAGQLAGQLRAMKAANPNLLRHFQYVVPKSYAGEPPVLRALKGNVESMSLNAVELPGLLSRLAAAKMGQEVLPPDASREQAEEVGNILAGAAALQDAMALERVHIHAASGDLVIQPAPEDPDRMVLSHLRARQLASMKAANESGQVRDPGDLWPIAPVGTAQGLAGVQAFADALAARFGLTAEEKAHVVERWWWKDERTGRVWAFAPTRGIHEDTGGKVSLGDTMDLVPLLLREVAE